MDMSAYPATKAGAWRMIDELSPDILQLWRIERQTQCTDDLVAVVNTKANAVTLEPRSRLYHRFRRLAPNLDLLKHFERPPTAFHGSIRLWVLIEFRTGGLCLVPFTIAHS